MIARESGQPALLTRGGWALPLDPVVGAVPRRRRKRPAGAAPDRHEARDLDAAIAGDVRVGHTLGRRAPVLDRGADVARRGRAEKRQPVQAGGGARFRPAPPDDEREVPLAIHRDDDAVARVLAIEGKRHSASADDERVLHDRRVGPAGVVVHLVRVRRVQPLDVDVLGVGRCRLHVPRDARVVPRGYAGQPRRRCANRVQPRRREVHEISARRYRRVSRIERHIAIERTGRRVAHRLREPEEERRRADAADGTGDDRAERRRIETRRHVADAIVGRERSRGAEADRIDKSPTEDLLHPVAARDERVGAVQQIVGRPQVRLPAGERERLRRRRPCAGDPRVDPAYEGLRNRARVGIGARPVIGGIDARLQPPRHRVALGEVRTQHFREAPLRRAPPQIHLEQTILRLHEPLREEQIVAALRVDVRDAGAVAHDAHRRRQPEDLQRPRRLRDKRRRRAFATFAFSSF